MANNDSLLNLLINIRNNQELYMRHQWKVAYLTFLLYAAIIGAFKLIGSERYLFIFILSTIVVASLSILIIIWKLDSSVKEHQKMADDIYDHFQPMREVVGPRQPQKKLTIIGTILSATVFIGMAISIIVLCSMHIERNSEFLQQVDKLDQKIDRCINTLEEIKIDHKIDNTIDQKINTVNDQLNKRIDQLKARIDGIETTIQSPKNVRSKEK